MRAGIVAALLIAGSLYGAVPAIAQPETCPADYVCFDYEGAQIQLDPEEGPYQLVIVAEVVTKTTTFTDETTERTVVAAGFAEGPDGTFTFDREYQRPRDGVFRDAELGDVLGLGE